MSSRSSCTSSPCRLQSRDRLAARGGDQVSERTRDRLGRLELVHQLQRVVLGRVGLDPAAVFLALDKTEHGRGFLRRFRSRPDRHRHRFRALRGLAASPRRRPCLGQQLHDLGLVARGRSQTVEHEVARGQHSRLVRGVRIRLGKNGEPVSQPHVGRAVPPLGRIRRPLRVIAVEIPVIKRLDGPSAFRTTHSRSGKNVCRMNPMILGSPAGFLGPS